MVLYHAFDREMLNAVGYSEKNKGNRYIIESIIENELKMLAFTMPLDECIVISPSFRFESILCRKILNRNRAFTENGIIKEYRREVCEMDFWLKKSENYHNAMQISDAYRIAYGEKSTYNKASQIWMDRIPKIDSVGLTSRDSFIENIKIRGIQLKIPSNQTEEVLKITAETRESTFLWEVEEFMLHKYNVSDRVIRDLGVRELMNQSYLSAFADKKIKMCRSSLGLVNIDNLNPEYDMCAIRSVLEREGVYNYIITLSAENILHIRCNPELQNVLDVVRQGLAQKDSVQAIHTAISEIGNLAALILKINQQPLGGTAMSTKEAKGLTEGSIRILHLSDLHFTDEQTMQDQYFYLKLDLRSNFNIFKIDYLIISGDVSDRPDQDMYNAALTFVRLLIEDFKISTERIILVPGNHDCDRDIAKAAYDSEEKNIVDRIKYNSRFNGYSDYFYRHIKGKPYPPDPEQQFEDFIFEEDCLCVLGLNSSCEIDQKNTERSSICMKAIQNSKSIWCDSSKFVKLAVWHHPLMGWAPIQNITFMDTLSVAGFKACFHGHIHEAKNDSFVYDAHSGIKMIGAGTFGAVQKERGDGIPRQYNIVEFDKKNRLLIVHTRKREKDNGMWQADARWEDKSHNPKSYYKIICNGDA